MPCFQIIVDGQTDRSLQKFMANCSADWGDSLGEDSAGVKPTPKNLRMQPKESKMAKKKTKQAKTGDDDVTPPLRKPGFNDWANIAPTRVHQTRGHILCAGGPSHWTNRGTLQAWVKYLIVPAHIKACEAAGVDPDKAKYAVS